MVLSSPHAPPQPQADARLDAARVWLQQRFPQASPMLTAASADASFRRYFRVDFGDGSATRILMDAPPEREDCRPFVKVAGLHVAAGLNAPQVLAEDLTNGFLLLTDLGRETYLQAFADADARRIDALFGAAIDALVRWQSASRPGVLPPYDEALLRRELELFREWFLGRHLRFELSKADGAMLDTLFAQLIDSALAQPKVYVHRDYMPRNLMISTPLPGILDFQDAVEGPISYDVMSLFRDAFVSWDEERTLDWTIRYWEKARAAGLPVREDFADFWREAEWMGLQRHLKVLGIFCRLNYRDGKADYLADLPRFLAYARHVAARYRALTPLLGLLDRIENRSQDVGYTF